MVHLISDYDLGYRLAIIEKDGETEHNDSFERLYYSDGRITFRSDNASIALNEKLSLFFDSLHSGDIISINSKGLCYVLYNQDLGDTVFFMGGKCNSNCIMCPAVDEERKSEFPNQLNETLALISMIPERINYFVVTGGEPTLNKDGFLQVIKALSDKLIDPNGIILTNGRSFSSEEFVDEYLKISPANTVVAIPVHASTPELHDYITRAKGSFRQTIKGICNLLKRKVFVEIRIVVTKVNCDDLLNIAKLITEHFPMVYRVHFISLEVRGNCIRNKDLVYISPEDSFKKSRAAIDYLVSHGINVGLYNYPLCNVDRKYWFLYKRSIAAEKAVYADNCSECDLRCDCGGLFVSTLKTVDPNTYPIKLLGEKNDKSF